MKKRLLMIFIIILVILLTPRLNRNSHRTKTNQGQPDPGRKVKEETEDFEFPLPGRWLLMNIPQDKKLRRQYAVCNTFVATGYEYNGYKPAQTGYGKYY